MKAANWQVDKMEDGGVRVATEDYIIAYVQVLPRIGQDLINANLIAAAPDLLAACQSICGVFEGCDDVPRYVSKARAAIAKAQGIHP